MEQIDSTTIVLVEHIIALVLMIPWAIYRRKQLFNLSLMEWGGVALIGSGASAIAMIFFTASFKYLNPSVTILLQNFQPILVITLAMLILGEKPRRGFFLWAVIAMVSGFFLSVPHFNWAEIKRDLTQNSKGIIYTLTAAGLWGIATVAGKVVLKNIAPLTVTFWRFFFGTLALAIIVAANDQPFPVRLMLQNPLFTTLIYIGIVTTLLAMICYYEGMKRTPAATTTLVELVFPISAVVLNTIFLKAPLLPVQLVCGAILLFSITRASADSTS